MANQTLSVLKSAEAELKSQIASLEEKLRGVQAVMPMFEDSTENTEGRFDKVFSKPFLEESTDAEEPFEEALVEPEPVRRSEKPIRGRTQKKTKSKRQKKDGRTANWQKYLREGVAEKSMPEAVLFFLQTQPEASFKVADVMTALFAEDIPRSQYLKARNRISNILSGGARNGDWSRVGNGVYSLSGSRSAVS